MIGRTLLGVKLKGVLADSWSIRYHSLLIAVFSDYG
jgi:hypothetical protein